MKRILFVDDEPKILEGLSRRLRGMRREWEMDFVESGREALEKLKEKTYEVLVTDMRMPGMDGGDVLNEVAAKYPWMVRIVLSGHSEREMILKAARPAHQFLSKPCDPEQLKTIVARACALREVVGSESVRNAVSRIETLPTVPHLYLEIMAELHKETSTAASIGRIIAQDIGMTTQILKAVNSSFFGFARHTSSPQEAVTLLGVDVIKALVLSANILKSYDGRDIPGFSLEGLWRHSLTVAGLAKRLAELETGDRKAVDDSFIAGLLHDVGKLVMAAELPRDFNLILELVREKNLLVFQAEREVLGISHAEIGGYLLALWALSDPVVEAVTYHHAPSDSLTEGFSPLAAVHVANVLEHRLVRISQNYGAPALDDRFLERTGLAGRLPGWLRSCLDLLKQRGKND